MHSYLGIILYLQNHPLFPATVVDSFTTRRAHLSAGGDHDENGSAAVDDEGGDTGKVLLGRIIDTLEIF